MLKYNFLLIFRNFKRNKSSFFINLIGLSSGLACAILIFLWVNDELHVDKFHANDAQLYQIMANTHLSNNIITKKGTPDILPENLANDFPEVELANGVAPSEWFGDFTLAVNNAYFKATGQFAEKDFFRIFSFPLIQGDAATVLAGKNSVAISESLALKLFHSTKNVIGKSLDVQILNLKDPVEVSGIFQDVPQSSSKHFDFVLSWKLWQDISKRVGRTVNWSNTGPETYVLLRKGTDVNAFNHKIANYIKSKNENLNLTIFAVRYSDRYLKGHYENGIQSGGRITYVRLFSVIALFILLIACINFMNLSTAKSSQRFKESGIKKAIGAGRWSLVFHHLSESIILAGLSLLVALTVVFLFLPQFNLITDKHLSLSFSPNLLIILPAVILFTGLISGSYPAFYLSRFNPAMVLKGKVLRNTGRNPGIRTGLVIFQFGLSVILIVVMLVVYKQVNFIQSRNLGYDKDQLIYFDKEGKVAENTDAFLARLKNIPGVSGTTSSNTILMGHASATSGISWEGKDPDEILQFEVVSVGYDFMKTLGIQLKEGRPFSPDFPTDSETLIFNEAAIAAMGLKDPVGKTVKFWGEGQKILGVAKDFNFESLHQKISPLVFRLAPKETLKIMVRLTAGREKVTLAELNRLYAQFNPGYSLDYHFLDQDYQKQYNAEIRVGILSKYFAGLGILISCLGLFGLAAYAAEQRIKEIGIRKVNGARISEVMTILNKDFVKWVAIAFIIAAPVAWYGLNRWLESFAYKTDLSWWIFALAGLLALGIALLTVSWQSWRAATRNPVEALRYE
ncbi:MAG: ABC transporter permease [Prolixibacteraceae bacterium]|jgi:ABC-type antimicrobial peptide transport system permease subunit